MGMHFSKKHMTLQILTWRQNLKFCYKGVIDGHHPPTIAFNLKNKIKGAFRMETNNISTIATFAAIIITTLLAYFGYTVDQAQLTTVLMGCITLIIAVWSSKNPNNLSWLGNAPEPTTDISGDEDETC